MKYKLSIIFLFVTLFSCSKDESDRIPNVFVDYRISTVTFDTQANSGVLVVNKGPNNGVAGLIIFKYNGTYKAYDRCSSVNPEQACAVVVDDSNLTATDPCSGAKFSLIDGTPVKAPAKRALKEYQVIISNFVLTVRN